MTELKPCPFCGGEAELWQKRTFHRYYEIGEKKLPSNAKVISSELLPDGRHEFWYCLREYGVGCKDAHCLGRSLKYFPTSEAAFNAWDRRLNDATDSML